MNEIKHEFTELVLLFFIIFFGLCWCDVGNREAIHKQAVYESQFSYDFEVSTGWLDAAVIPEDTYKRKYRRVRPIRD